MEHIELEYKKPIENSERVHRIEMTLEGRVIGYANLEYRNDPFPFYYLKLIFIKGYRGQGLGTQVLTEVNAFLDAKKKPGLLVNAISRTSPARRIYEKHGWVAIPGHEDWYSYGLPDLELGQLEKAIYVVGEQEH
jgi:GNAT superfamily N-acetyltransferase